MYALTDTIYLVNANPEPDWEDEFNRWYWQEHLPNLLAVPGYRAGHRYVAVDGEPKYLALWEIDSVEAYDSPEHAQAVNTPWTAKVKEHNTSQMAFYRQLNPAKGLMRGPAYGDGQTPAGGLMVFRMDVAPEHEQEFNAWYDEEHLPALCSVEGVIGARRFKALRGGPKYAATYYLTEAAVQDTEAWAKARDTEWTVRMRPKFLNRWRTVYRPLEPPR
jgi:hypothetical protein